MAAVFLKLLNLSISASWLVLAVLVLRLVSKRSPKWMNVLLWGMVALRLMLPFSIESALSLIPSAETLSPEVVRFDPAPTITSGVEFIDNAVNPSLSESFAAAPLASVNPLYVWTYLAGWVWLIGLGVMLLYALVSYLRLRRRVSVSLHIQDNIYLCDGISSPFILGVVKPRIYLPSGLDEVQRQNVLSHERAHLTRRDHWWKPLGFALLAVYWFNPVLWLAYALLCRDIELACDERVIRTMDESAVKTYSTVLLACSMPRKAVITCPLAFGEVGVKERVRNALRYKKPAFWVIAASVTVCIVVAVCFLTNPPTDTDAAGLVGFHREQVTYADVTDESGAQPSNVQLTAEETDAVYALLDALQYKRLGAASAMEDCYARLYFISAAGERCEIMLSEREMLVNPITDGKTARLYELRSGSTELRDYLFGCIGASESAEEEMKTMTEPTLSLTLTVPAAWEDIAELSACDKGTAYLGYGIMLFHLSEKNALAAYPDGGMGSVWWLVAMSWDNFKEWRGYDALPVPEILGIAEYVLGADDEYVYLLVLPSDVQFLLNDPVSQRQYEALQSDSQGVLTRFLKDNGIHINDMCPASSVFSPPARGGAAITTGYAAYDALLAEISGLRRSGASEVQTDFSHDLLSVNDYYQTPGWLLRDLDGDGIPELLLGANWDGGHAVIFNIYRSGGARAVRVVNGWNRNRWYLCTDGSLANEGSSSAFESSCSYYRYTSGELQHLETLLYLDDGSGGSPWRYSVTTDQYVNSGDFHSVTEAEATAVMDKYTHETLSFTPFVV
ncbi:MAG: M56 family metallopeptidase [Oscillibacter sp.]|nr:M56 family metallopeptidase [Oscillibacter sp.]